MNKIVILTDPHFGVSNFSITAFEQQMYFFEKQLFPYLIEHKIKDVICCGDFFNSREKITWIILEELKARFFKWFCDHDINFHVLVGNHDTLYKDRIIPNSLANTANGYKNIIVYQETTIVTIEKYIFAFVPWIVDMEKYKFPERCDIIIGHLELKDFPMMRGINAKEGYEYTTFKKYQRVYSGHYHINHNCDNVFMIGTPYQLTWNDYHTTKGFYVLKDNFEHEYVHNNVSPRFVKLYYDNGIITVEGLGDTINTTLVESLEIVKKNFCRLYVKAANDQLALEKYHTSLLAISCNNYKIEMVTLADVIENFDSDEFDEALDEDDAETFSLILKLIDGMTFEKDIDKDILLLLTKKEIKKALDEAYGIGDE